MGGRGHIRKRAKGSYSIVIDLGRNAEGKRKQKWVTVRGSRKDAERTLTELLRALDTGTLVQPGKLTVGEFLKRWLKDYAEQSVSAKTLERYEEIVRLHLIPALGHHQLSDLQPLHVQDYYSFARRNGRVDGKGGLAAQTVLHHHRLLRAALQQGVRWQLVARNVADAVEPPKVKPREVYVLDGGNSARLLAAARETNQELYVGILLALATGLRRGEILGLRWADIDLSERTLSVRRSLQETKEGLSFKEPKTRRSQRLVLLPELAVAVLRQHRAVQAERKLRLGELYADEGLVISGEDGSPIRPNTFSKAFAQLARNLELPVNLHGLRHAHATQLLRQGVHPKIVSERLGHSTVGLTLDRYSHVVPSMQGDAADATDAFLGSALEANFESAQEGSEIADYHRSKRRHEA